MPEWIGQTIGKVRIEKYLARGGMAEVYLGTHLTLERPVAVKVMHSHIESDPELQSRFQREAKAVAGLRHSNIVQILDFDTYEGHPYIVMEYLRGPSLSTYLRALHEKKTKLRDDQTGHLMKSLAGGIDYAHAQGIIHRDIKPANILLHNKSGEFSEHATLTRETEPIITDFGLVRIAHSGTQTASGLVSGTPAYMSPEQARAGKVDYRSDIYSLGVVLYELLAGRVPFEGDTSMEVILKHIHEPPPPIENVSPELQAVIDKALAKDPIARYQNCRHLAADFLEAVGLHAEVETLHSAPTQPPQTAATSTRKSGGRWTWIAAGTLGCACLGFFLLSALGITAVSLFPKEPIAQTAPTSINTAEGEYVLDPQELAPGVLRFQDGSAPMDQITISAGLTLPPDGTQYEAWLISDNTESRKSLGILTPGDSGQFTLTYLDSQSRNLLAEFNRMEITVEANPDTSPNPSGEVAYSSEIPAGALTHIRHLLVRFEATPDHVGLSVGLVNASTLIQESADAMLEAFESGNTATVRSNGEAIVNLIVGKQATGFYQDWDRNGKISDPGDGFGLLLNGDQAGYIGSTIDHAKLAAGSSDSTPEIRIHSEHVVICVQNVETWAAQLRDIAVRIAQSGPDQILEADVRSATALANQLLEGIDINGNESVDPIPAEGGALTAFAHADYMSDMPILEGEGQVPASGQ